MTLYHTLPDGNSALIKSLAVLMKALTELQTWHSLSPTGIFKYWEAPSGPQ